MKRRIALLLLCLAAAGLFLAPAAGALAVPPLVGHINDYGRIISPRTAEDLEQELTRFEASDATQIVVLTIPSLEGEDLEGFSIKVAEAWKIGSKGVDNGVILLVARDDRKVRIEVGRGLEGRLTDLVSGRIIRNSIIPRFRQGDFDGGISAGVRDLMAVTRGEYRATGPETTQSQQAGAPFLTLLVFLFIALIFAGALSRVLGAAAGAVGLPVAAKLSFSTVSVPVLVGLGLVGLILGLVLHALFSGGGPSRGRGRRGGGGGGGGAFLGGLLLGGLFRGGPFSGGDSGGGFSGGGGDFGGGGASGGW
jgi:uncharacterized protein